MTKRKIRFRCYRHAPWYEFETDEWYSFSVSIDAETEIRVSAKCPECENMVQRYFRLSEIFEMIMTIDEGKVR